MPAQPGRCRCKVRRSGLHKSKSISIILYNLIYDVDLLEKNYHYMYKKFLIAKQHYYKQVSINSMYMCSVSDLIPVSLKVGHQCSWPRILSRDATCLLPKLSTNGGVAFQTPKALSSCA